MDNERTATTIFSIGYQMRLVEQLIDDLKRNGVKLLVDLRERPQSRKPGYSSRQFPRALEEAGIDYVWMGKTLGGFTCTKEQWAEGCKELAGYAHMETTCVMCLEHDVKECHRRKLLDILRSEHELEAINL